MVAKHNCTVGDKKRPANEEGGPPGIKVKFIRERSEGAFFPILQGKTFSAKTSLTKSSESLDTAVAAFNSLGNEETLLKPRKAMTLMLAVEKVDSRKHLLEDAYEKVISHVNELKKEYFDPQTPPEQMAEHIE